MAELARARPIVQAETLLTYYGFDLSGYTVNRTVQGWLQDYRADWIPAAIVEALYQGRYKAISVSQILSLWKRRGQPLRHFNHEFETIICRELPYPPELTSLLLPPSRPASSPSSSPSLDNVVELPIRSQTVGQFGKGEELLFADETSTDKAIRSSLPMTKTAAPSSGHDTGGSSHDSADHGLEPVDQDGIIISSDDLTEPALLGEQPVNIQACDRTQSDSSTPDPTADQQTLDAIPPFQPTPLNRRAELRVLQVSNSSKSGITPPDSIHQFIPEAGLSNTHAKLKAVAQPDAHSEEP